MKQLFQRCQLPIIFGVMLLLNGLTTFAQAQAEDIEAREQPIQEVFQTGLVYPQERGEVQLSYTSRFSKGKDHSSLQTPLNLEYGITDRWQIEIEWDALSRRTEGKATTRGRGDLSIGTQYSFMNIRRSNFHSAVGFEVSLPTGSVEKELSEGFIEYEPYLIIARDFPKLNNMQIFSQVGVGFVQRARRQRADADKDEPAAHEFNLGVGMFVPFRHLVFTSEFNLSTNRWNNGGREREMYATPGVVWRLPRNWEIGVGAPFGLTRDADKSGAILRVVYEFGTRRGDESR